ncbi:MAG: GNAT family N-acetyltransferase [Pseudomonadota bacterium]
MTDPLTNAPTLSTERLTLRGPTRADLEAFTTFVTTNPQMAEQGETGSESDAWFAFLAGVGHWQWHGYGFFILQTHDDPAPLGRVGILNHRGWDRPELAWHLYEGSTGKGYATEAATCIRAWAAETHGLTRLVSYIHRSNSRSQAVATRLGAVDSGAVPVHAPDATIWEHPEVAA